MGKPQNGRGIPAHFGFTFPKAKPKARPKVFNPAVQAKLNAGAKKNGLGTVSPFADAMKSLTGDTPKAGHPGQMTHGFNLKDPSQVKDVQRFLKSRGYNVAVDGQWGKLSESAFTNFHATSGQSPKQRENAATQWSMSRLDNNGVPVNNGSPNPGGAPIGGFNTPATTSAPPASNGLPSMSPDMAKLLASIAKESNFDPRGQAESMANAAYNPTIAYDQAAMDSHGSTIQQWFDNVIGQNKKDTGADTAALNSGLANETDLFKNIAGSLTDNAAAAQVAKAGAIDTSGLQGIGAAQGNYDRNMDTSLALMGRDAQTNQRNKDQLQLRQDQQARAAALMQLVPSLQSSSIQDKTNLFNLYMQQLMLPTQMQSAGLDSAYKQTQIAKNIAAINRPPKAARPMKYDTGKIQSDAWKALNIDPKTGTYPTTVTSVRAAKAIATAMRNQGMRPGDGHYRATGMQILQSIPGLRVVPIPGGYFSGRGPLY